jgi:MoxR-vWA-beta-propeller ternary system protein
MHKQINQLRASLMAQFPERKDVIDGSLAAVLAGEHVLLIGPPGTAKSALVRCLAQVFGGSYFERLLTKFSTPEELFGPISLQGLAQDRFVRLTAGKLPEAEFAFVDEIFKSNSAVLNALLSVINERVFHNDGAPVRCPLVSLFAASNELPEGKELEALFDRFLLRFDVGYLLVAANLRGQAAGAGEVRRPAGQGGDRRRGRRDPGPARRGRARGQLGARAAEPAMRRIIFDVPLWSLYLYRTARGLPRADPSDAVERALEDELFERLYAGEAEPMPEAQRVSPLASWAQRIHDTIAQLPAFERLAQNCRGRAEHAGEIPRHGRLLGHDELHPWSLPRGVSSNEAVPRRYRGGNDTAISGSLPMRR